MKNAKTATKGGLEGVTAADSAICKIDGKVGELRYRGYLITELAEHTSFLETTLLLLNGELPTRAELEQIPDGTYHYTDHSDGDGVVDETIKIQVALTIDGSDISVDFSGSHPQTIGGMNCPLAVTYSSVQFAIKAAADSWGRCRRRLCGPRGDTCRRRPIQARPAESGGAAALSSST